MSFCQENPEITKRLKEKYGEALFREGNDICYYQTLKNGKWGACESDGREITPPIWGYIEFWNTYFIVHEGVEADQEDVKYGLLDTHGKLVIPCIYDFIYSYQLPWGIAVVENNNHIGLYDIKNGKQIIPCKYGNMRLYKDSDELLIPVRQGTINDWNNNTYKWGVVTNKDKIMIPFVWDDIISFSEGLFICNKGGKFNEKENKAIGGTFGYIDKNGKEIIPCQYEIASMFEDGIAQVVKGGISSFITNPLTGTNLQVGNGINSTSKVDVNIPETGKNDENTFAFIIANENYTHYSSSADFSINDGKVFANYCRKTLGLPEKNVRYFEDATYGNIVNAIKKLQDIADVYEGDAKIIFYFSGLGATDEKNMEKYLLATDGSITALNNTGYSVNQLMQILNELNVKLIWVVLDAPFANMDKKGKSLLSSRGVSIKPKGVSPKGNVVLTEACDVGQTAYSSKQLGHSLLTYSLLEKIQETTGKCTLQELSTHATLQTKKLAMKEYDKMQAPITNVSENINNMWNTINF